MRRHSLAFWQSAVEVEALPKCRRCCCLRIASDEELTEPVLVLDEVSLSSLLLCLQRNQRIPRNVRVRDLMMMHQKNTGRKIHSSKCHCRRLPSSDGR